MPSTFTATLRFELQAPGSDLNTWGGNLNTNAIALIDFAIGGVTALTPSGPITLTSANGAADQSRSAILNCTSGTGGTLTIPAVSKVYQVRNNCSGNVIITTGAGSTATVEPGSSATVISDGTNCYRFSNAADIAACLAASKAYTDAAAFASSSGILPGQPGNAGKYLQTNGTTPSWVAIMSSDVTGALGYVPQVALGYTPLNPANNLSDLANAGTARVNLGLGTSAIVNIGASGATVPLLNGANVWSTSQTLSPGNAHLFMDGTAGQERQIFFTTTASKRWGVHAGTDAESGGNAGSTFEISRYSDAGSFIDTPFFIDRSTGLVTVIDGLEVFSGGLTVVSGGSVFGGNAQTTPVAVAFNATTMALNCALSNVFKTVFTANVTSAPTLSNPSDGQTINWRITQDGTGSRTMTWPASFKWVNGAAGVLSTAAGAVDLLVATWFSDTSTWAASLSKGFA